MTIASSLARAPCYLAAALVLLYALSAHAGRQDFTVVNDTGVEIHELYVSAHESDDWEEDILGEDTLPDGDGVEISFSPKEKAALWDLKVVDGEGNEITWESLNLLKISKLTLHYDQKKRKAWADAE